MKTCILENFQIIIMYLDFGILFHQAHKLSKKWYWFKNFRIFTVAYVKKTSTLPMRIKRRKNVRNNISFVTSPTNSTPRRFPSYLLLILLLYFLFHLLFSPVLPTGFTFCSFPGFLAIFIMLSSNNN